MGLSMALLEIGEVDPVFGDFANHDFAGYHIAAHADVPRLDVVCLEETDNTSNPVGAKGIGELGIVGAAAAIGNAFHHATGERVRDLPIRIERSREALRVAQVRRKAQARGRRAGAWGRVGSPEWHATTPKGRATYHHGDLAAALVEASLEIIDEVGVRGFSVAEAARRTCVSPGAPYRHFAPTVTRCSRPPPRWRSRGGCGPSTWRPRPRPAPLRSGWRRWRAGFVRAAARYRGGLDILFAPGLRATHPELRDSTREFVDLLLPSAFEVIAPGEGPATAVALLDALHALARGYVAQLLEGKFGDPKDVVEGVATRATQAARALVAGYGVPSRPVGEVARDR
ncbi:hypothetical protein SANTM175S_00241 [Streptomyces antimycoticus]